MYTAGSIIVGVARGRTGCACTLEGKEKIVGQIYTGKCTPRQTVHPSWQLEKSPFLGNWGDFGGGRGYLGSFNVF